MLESPKNKIISGFKLLSFIKSHDLNSDEAKLARRQLSSILFN